MQKPETKKLQGVNSPPWRFICLMLEIGELTSLKSIHQFDFFDVKALIAYNHAYEDVLNLPLNWNNYKFIKKSIVKS